jgi:hypothetical protein
MSEVTRILSAIEKGDANAADQLLPLVYDELRKLAQEKPGIWSLAWSPDGTTLVSGSGNSTVRLWDTKPLRNRYQARRQAEALRPEAERLVEKLLHEKKDAAEVAAAIRANRSLSEPQRHAALRALLPPAIRAGPQERR